MSDFVTTVINKKAEDFNDLVKAELQLRVDEINKLSIQELIDYNTEELEPTAAVEEEPKEESQPEEETKDE